MDDDDEGPLNEGPGGARLRQVPVFLPDRIAQVGSGQLCGPTLAGPNCCPERIQFARS